MIVVLPCSLCHYCSSHPLGSVSTLLLKELISYNCLKPSAHFPTCPLKSPKETIISLELLNKKYFVEKTFHLFQNINRFCCGLSAFAHQELFLQLTSIHISTVNQQISTNVVVITSPLLQDEGTAQTAMQVHAVNLIEIRQGKDGSSFRSSHE